MPKDLEVKVASLVREIEKMSVGDKTAAIIRLISHETAMVKAERQVTFADLLQIHSSASTFMGNVPKDLVFSGKLLAEYPELIRALCFVRATYQWLRSEQMTPYMLSFGIKNSDTR